MATTPGSPTRTPRPSSPRPQRTPLPPAATHAPPADRSRQARRPHPERAPARSPPEKAPPATPRTSPAESPQPALPCQAPHQAPRTPGRATARPRPPAAHQPQQPHSHRTGTTPPERAQTPPARPARTTDRSCWPTACHPPRRARPSAAPTDKARRRRETAIWQPKPRRSTPTTHRVAQRIHQAHSYQDQHASDRSWSWGPLAQGCTRDPTVSPCRLSLGAHAPNVVGRSRTERSDPALSAATPGKHRPAAVPKSSPCPSQQTCQA